MRKELLLGTTALLAAAVAMPEYASAEDPLRLSVRGYKNEYVGIGDTDVDGDATDYGNTSHFSDGEVHFKGETDLDNGLTIGVDVQLEAFDSGDQIDEAYTWVQGDFGKVILGSENSANYLSFWAVTAPNVGVPINSGWISIWSVLPSGVSTAFRRPLQTTNLELRNDNFGISYATPRFAGFSFNISWAPTAAGGSNSGDPKNFFTDEDEENHDLLALGISFAESFNGVDLGFAAGYNRASVADAAETLGADDPQQFKVGVSVGTAGFTIAGSYANEFEGQRSLSTGSSASDAFDDALDAIFDALDGGATTSAAFAAGSAAIDAALLPSLGRSTEGQSWDIGASYSTGPWGVSATWFHGEIEGGLADPDDDEVDSIVGAVSYALGPGITTSLSVIYTKWEDESGLDSDTTMGVLGLGISF